MKAKLLLLLMLFSVITGSAQEQENYIENDFRQGWQNGEKAALLIVHFGTTHDDTRSLTIEAVNQKARQTFTDLEVREAYTSRIIIKRLKARGIEKLTPLEALLRLRADGFTRVIVQGTNIIAGEEYESLCRDVERVAAFFRDIRIGKPLFYHVGDMESVVDIITQETLADVKKHQHVVFVGHGTTTPATATYSQLDYMLKATGHTNYHVGTIEGYPTFDTMLAQLKEAKAKEVILVPLMLVAGEHATNDISIEWKEALEAAGFKVSLHLQGLGQTAAIQDIFISHIRHALQYKERSIIERKSKLT